MLTPHHIRFHACSHLNERRPKLPWQGTRAGRPPGIDCLFRLFQNMTMLTTHLGFVGVPRFAPMPQPASDMGVPGSVVTRGTSTFGFDERLEIFSLLLITRRMACA